MKLFPELKICSLSPRAILADIYQILHILIKCLTSDVLSEAGGDKLFQEACRKNRESIYFVVGNTQQICDAGSGFMIAPGILATVRHLIHK